MARVLLYLKYNYQILHFMKFIVDFIAGFLGVFLVVALISALINPSSSSSNCSHSYYDGRSHTGRITWARENAHYTPPSQSTTTSSYAPVYTTPSRSYGNGNNHYAELWSECEDLEALLEDYDIDHECMTYPMDYYDLQDLIDEYQYLLDEYSYYK